MNSYLNARLLKDKNAVALMLAMAFIPFSSIRYSGIPVTFFAFIPLIMLYLWGLLRGDRVWSTFHTLIVLFLILCLTRTSTPDQMFIAFKSIIYFVMFAAFYNVLNHTRDWERVIIAGSALGVTLFLVMIIYGIIISGLTFENIVNFSYWKFTYRIFQSLIAADTSVGAFEGRMITRNAVGDAIALLASILIINKKNWGFIIGLVEIFVLQSRRALAAVFLSFALSEHRTMTKVFILSILVLSVLFLVTTIGWSGETRFESLEGGVRMDQYTTAIALWNEQWFLGWGYGAKLYGSYVHNFVLSSMFMLGVFGLIGSMAIVAYVAMLVFRVSKYRALLFIPLANWMIAPTIEGITTISAWLAIAIVMTEIRASSRIVVRQSRRMPQLAAGRAG